MKKSPSKARSLLFQYLSDHLAASVGGIALARRCLRNNTQGNLGNFLRAFIPEIEGEHDQLRNFLIESGQAPSLFKMGAFWLAEKFGRLKLNQSLVSYSDLSRLFELEGLLAGVKAKVDMWKILETLPIQGEFGARSLVLQGERQLARIQELCLEAGARAFREASSARPAESKEARRKDSRKRRRSEATPALR